jgi:hypothetical protein
MSNAVKAWAADVAVRAVKTAAQTLVAMLGAGAVNILHVDWLADLAVAAGAAVTCVLQNVASFPSSPATVVVPPALPSPDQVPADPPVVP